MIMEISVAVIAAAFVFLVIYLIVLALSIRSTLKNVDNILIDTRTQINDIGPQTKEKIEAFDPLFRAISNVGEVLENKSTILKYRVAAHTLEEKTRSCGLKSMGESSESFHTHRDSGNYVEDVIEFVALGVCLWQKLKNRR